MTAAAVSHGPDVIVERVPEYFRLSDENPFTRRTYAVSIERDLPPYISEAIETSLGLNPRRWNDLVWSGRVLETIDVDQAISLRRFLNSVRQRTGTPPRHLRDYCEDCWGTCAQLDKDGSLTGDRNAVVLCICTMNTLSTRPTTSDTRVVLSCHERGWL